MCFSSLCYAIKIIIKDDASVYVKKLFCNFVLKIKGLICTGILERPLLKPLKWAFLSGRFSKSLKRSFVLTFITQC